MSFFKDFEKQKTECKQRIKETFAIVSDFYDQFVFKKSFILTALLPLTLAYAFSTLSRTVSIDDLVGGLYTGEGNAMISGYRWFFVVWNRVHGLFNCAPFMSDFFALIMLALSAINLCVILRMLDPKKDVGRWNYIVFFCIFTTFPLINEVWEYSGTSTALYGNLVFSTFALIYMLSAERKMNLLDYLFCGLLLTPSSSSYEASLVFYVPIVFSVLLLKKYYDKDYKWFTNGILFAITLFIAIFNKFFIGKILILIYGVKHVQNGATTINWLSGDLYRVLYEIGKNVRSYIFAYSYFPIGEFVAALLIFIILIFIARAKSHKGVLLIGFFFVLSLFSLSFLQGSELMYRTAQTIQYFVAFVSYIFLLSFDHTSAYKVMVVLMLFLSLRQAVFMNNMLQLNNQRSDNELYIVRSIGYRLYNEFDTEKTVIFCGKYDIGDYIDELKPDEMQSNINSCINWAVVANNNQNMMKQYMSFCGFDIKVTDQFFDRGVRKQYEEIAKKNGMKPFDIKDMGDYILVYFGEED